jgi:hypothetical protein
VGQISELAYCLVPSFQSLVLRTMEAKNPSLTVCDLQHTYISVGLWLRVLLTDRI